MSSNGIQMSSNSIYGVQAIPPPNAVTANPEYKTWADNKAINVTVDGVDARTAIAAFSLLCQRDPAYYSIALDRRGSLTLIKRLFELEFGGDMPSAEMAVSLGAKPLPQEAEQVLRQLHNESGPY
jgi:hypothetical protein